MTPLFVRGSSSANACKYRHINPLVYNSKSDKLIPATEIAACFAPRGTDRTNCPPLRGEAGCQTTIARHHAQTSASCQLSCDCVYDFGRLPLHPKDWMSPLSVELTFAECASYLWLASVAIAGLPWRAVAHALLLAGDAWRCHWQQSGELARMRSTF